MDVLLFFDKKRIVDTGEVTLYPSEVHMLVRALQGMSLTDIARHFAVSPSAVSQTMTRLVRKGVVVLDKDPQRNNAATVRLTPLGERVVQDVAGLQDRIGHGLAGCLAHYNEAELQTVERFLGDIHEFVRSALLGLPTTSTPAPTEREPR